MGALGLHAESAYTWFLQLRQPFAFETDMSYLLTCCQVDSFTLTTAPGKLTGAIGVSQQEGLPL